MLLFSTFILCFLYCGLFELYVLSSFGVNMLLVPYRESWFGFGDQRLTKPHIVFVLVDDWGYADVSFRNPAIISKCLQKLVSFWTDIIMFSNTVYHLKHH